MGSNLMATRPTPLRGRTHQLDLIGQRLREAGTGQGSVLIVEGRPGLGKTALLRAAAETARHRGIRVGWGTATAGDQVVPMAPLVSALFDGADPMADPEERGRLHYLLEHRHRLLDELQAVLDQAVRRSPILLCLDDMQWADAGSLVALQTLPVRLAGVPIVWLAAFRAGQTPPGPRAAIETLRGSGADSLLLASLEAAATEEIVTDVVRARPDPALLALAQRAHGSPFLLMEMLRGLEEERLLRIEAGCASLIEAKLPRRVRDGMRDRLSRMSELAGRLAGVAAVLGRSFSFEQLAAILDVSPFTLLAPVEELLRADLFFEVDGALGFRHDLLREAVQATLPASAYRALQRQAVTALIATGVAPVEVAVALAASATPGDVAAARTLQAAAAALSTSDPSTAADLGRRALELIPDHDPLRAPLAAQTIQLLHAAGRAREGRDLADGVLRQLMPVDQEAEVRLTLAGLIALAPDLRVTAGLRALELPSLSPRLRARHLAVLTHNLLVAGEPARAEALVPEARDLVASTADPTAAFALELAEGGLAYARGDFARSLELINSAARKAVLADDPARALLAREWNCEQLALVDRYDESMQITVDSLKAARQGRQGWGVRLWEAWYGRQLLQVGRLADAAAALEAAVETPGGTALVGMHEASAIVALGRVAIHTGDGVQLKRCAAIMREVRDTDALSVRRHAAWLLAHQASAAGDRTELRRQLHGLTLLPLFPRDVIDPVHLVRMAVAIGDDELAAAAAEHAADQLRRNPGVLTLAGVAAQARGILTGSFDDLAEAVTWFERGPRPLATASAQEDAGVAAHRHGRPDEAVELLGAALETYTRAGAAWDAGRVRGRLRELGVRRRLSAVVRPQQGWAALTRSELDVVRLVAQGMTNRMVAEQLFLSAHTVSTHLRHAFSKLGITSRAELTHLIARHEYSAA
ncbi:ATP-binding protein [Actinoplanes sp. HUAS TT8]|uniref:ATP-binding protein n=1 Tax=Actinoplanes sp. HUAS TT8 TaxID=3447453 RepID=UPI003F52717A